MTERRILDELTRLLETHGVEIRREDLGGKGGGLCIIQGRSVLFLDDQAPLEDQLDACAEAVAKAMDLETCYVKPQVREYIDARGR